MANDTKLSPNIDTSATNLNLYAKLEGKPKLSAKWDICLSVCSKYILRFAFHHLSSGLLSDI